MEIPTEENYQSSQRNFRKNMSLEDEALTIDHCISSARLLHGQTDLRDNQSYGGKTRAPVCRIRAPGRHGSIEDNGRRVRHQPIARIERLCLSAFLLKRNQAGWSMKLSRDHQGAHFFEGVGFPLLAHRLPASAACYGWT